MGNIVYLCNYMREDVLKQRNNSNTFAQAANNKIKQIKKALSLNGYDVIILSTGLVNNRSFRFFKGFKSKIENNLIYTSIIDIPLLNTLSSILFMFIQLCKIHRKNRIEYIIFWNYKPEVALVAWLCKIILNIKIIVDYEDGYFALKHIGRGKIIIFNLVEKLVSRSLDGAILISKHLLERIPKKVKFVILEGVTNEEVIKRVKKLNKIRNKKITLMYSGGLDEERGIDILLESLKYTKSDFKLVITGKGPLETVVKNNTDKRLEYLGYLEYDKVIKYMNNAHILVNPQKEKLEFAKASFPSKIFDYIATGNLIISSNIGNMKEFSGGSFYVYTNDDPVELAKQIDLAIDDIKNGNIEKRINKIEQSKDYYSFKNVSKLLQELLSN